MFETERRAVCRPPYARAHFGYGARAEQGTVLLMILLALFAIGLMSMVVAQVASTEVAITANITASQQTFLPADGASQVLLRDLINMSRSLGRFPTDAELGTITAPSYNNVNLTQFTAFADGGVQQTTLADGLHIGLSAEIQPFRIVATTASAGPPASQTTVEIQGEFASIPIYQFGVLYEGDLDVHNGPAMTITGRVHSNGNVYLDPNISVTFESTVTTAGAIYNAHEAGYVVGGAVYIEDAEGVNQAMAGLDSPDSNWTSDSISRWDGRVRSADTGGDRIDLVIEDPSNPRLIIDAGRSTDTAADQVAKLWYDAGLRVVNGRGYDADGNLVSTVDPNTGTDAIRFTYLYDWREEQYMLAVEVDVDKLSRASGYPANGVLYLGAFQPDADMPAWPGSSPGVGPAEWASFPAPWSSTATEFAVKLRNGADLPDALTVVTENPMYVHGSYNTIDKEPAAILADAVTILSNNWGDTDDDGDFDSDINYSVQSLSNRNAAATTVNAAIMTGIVDMGSSYNGGLENLPRLLEQWSGVQLTLLGSLAALWESEYADGTFGKSGVYGAANRNWNFDTDFLDLTRLPPETPRIYKITVTGWQRR